MRKLLFFTLTLLSIITTNSQTRRTFTVNPGQKLMDAIPFNEIYTFPEFRTATIELRNGTIATVKVNYNAIYGEIQYIDPKKGDTLSLSQEKNIRYIAVEKDSFFFDNDNWLLVIDNDTSAKMAKKRLLTLANKEKMGPMNTPGFAAIDTYTSYTGSQQMRGLVAQERLTFSEHVEYFFGDRFNHFSKANKKNLLNLYRGDEEKIETWLKSTSTNFTKEDDLKQLFAFVKSL